uniref:Secretion protein HlyD family protein n=1 Tax=Leptospirillum ferrodiazotrophum TaxID=412449 RepID=C6I0Q6_9BACT|nr:MAG: secretion protein HlyD family protein [Leptospirillum ferrodiazotrophum]
MSGVQAGTPPEADSGRNRRRGIIIGVAGLLATAVIALLYMRYNEFYVSTEDSMVDGDIVMVSANTRGRVMTLPVNMGDPVHKGDLLARIDTTGFGALESIGQRNVSAFGDLARTKAQEVSLSVRLANARRDLARGEALRKGGFITDSDLDHLRTVVDDLNAQLAEIRKLAFVNRTALETTESHPLNYTIHSPLDGQVAERIVQVGQVVSRGQAVVSLVDPKDTWVTAKVKETRMGHVRVGQKVDITIDAYPGRKFHGHVFQILPTSAAAISLLPPENASGTFVKVTQRVPVRISIDDARDVVLRPGLSTEVRIHIRDGSPW